MTKAWRLPPALIGVFNRYVPFADAASPDLPLARLLRLSLFQVAVGITTALLVGTLNRVMIVELGVPAWWVALSVALPLVFAPMRAFIGYRSDTHPSVLGLRRLPYLWIGTLLMFGGLAIMPFALLLLSEADTTSAMWLGRTGAALAFIVVGAGLQISQTAGIALANDVASDDKRPRVVALLYAMLLVGLIAGSAMLGGLLAKFSPVRLIQVVQGAAVLVVVLNLMSLWKQEARGARRGAREPDGFRRNWQRLMALPKMRRFLWTVGLGTAAFSMQDIVLEPYGGQVLGLNVGMTSGLTALSAGGALLAFALSSRFLRSIDAVRLAAIGALLGLPAFACVIFSAPLGSALMFQTGAALIGFGGGLFSVGMLLTAMEMTQSEQAGMVLGAWGAVQATASGVAMAFGGVARDVVGQMATQGRLGEVLVSDVTGYNFVFQTEMVMMFVVLVALGPLVSRRPTLTPRSAGLGLAELPG